MKAVILHTVAGTTAPMEITGEYLTEQMWPGGMARVAVFDRQGGKKLRVVHFAKARLIEVEVDSGD